MVVHQDALVHYFRQFAHGGFQGSFGIVCRQDYGDTFPVDQDLDPVTAWRRAGWKRPKKLIAAGAFVGIPEEGPRLQFSFFKPPAHFLGGGGPMRRAAHFEKDRREAITNGVLVLTANLLYIPISPVCRVCLIYERTCKPTRHRQPRVAHAHS
jgi:hypothetical protein